MLDQGQRLGPALDISGFTGHCAYISYSGDDFFCGWGGRELGKDSLIVALFVLFWLLLVNGCCLYVTLGLLQKYGM